ncbi:MAG: hypothetical protein AAFR75_09765, partial [Pseudomonadota bacterium]
MVAKLTLGICQRVAERAANQCVSGLYGAIAGKSLIAVFAVLMPLQDAQHVHAASQNLYDAKTGYRIKHYRSAVPTDVPGGTLVDIDTVERPDLGRARSVNARDLTQGNEQILSHPD